MLIFANFVYEVEEYLFNSSWLSGIVVLVPNSDYRDELLKEFPTVKVIVVSWDMFDLIRGIRPQNLVILHSEEMNFELLKMVIYGQAAVKSTISKFFP